MSLVPIRDLTDLYQEYLNNNAMKATHQQYNETLRRLKLILYLMKVNIPPQAPTDDRPPTCYFKIWSKTRPTKKQTQPLELKDYHLIPSLPLHPSKVCCAFNSPTHTPDIVEINAPLQIVYPVTDMTP